MMGRADYYDANSYNAICDRCGFKFKASQLKEEWNGLMVCKECWEPRHPQDFLRGIPDDPSVPWTRPDQACTVGSTFTDVEGNTVSADCCGSPNNYAGSAIAGCAIAGFKTFLSPL